MASKRVGMGIGRHAEGEVIDALQHVEAGQAAAEVDPEPEVSKCTIYAWKAKYKGLQVCAAAWPQPFEDENRKRL
jgi:Transposase